MCVHLSLTVPLAYTCVFVPVCNCSGAILGVALIGFGVFYWARKRRNSMNYARNRGWDLDPGLI